MTQDFRTTKRRWIKVYSSESINGSIRYQLSSAERGVWYDLLSFSALCSNTGDICDRDGNAFPLSYIANRLNIKVSLLRSALDKCITDDRIREDDAGIHIVNWKRYQSEYDRTKQYRETKQDQEPAQPGENHAMNELLTSIKADGKYSSLDLDDELIKFNLYWSEGDRKLKRPKLALRNWLNNTLKRLKEDNNKNKPNEPKIGKDGWPI